MPDRLRRPRVAFYVQHLLGIGHLVRARRIAEALAADNWAVDLIIGGELPPGFTVAGPDLVALPPVRAGAGSLSALLHPDGLPFDAGARDRRRDILLAQMAARPPDVLIVEAYPFGRRQMRFELLPLLAQQAGRAKRPLIASSIRDILQGDRSPERVAETLGHLERFFDLVLVHGDPALVRLEDSFPAARQFASKIAYTGFVAPSRPAGPVGAADIVVSVGGGAVGEALLRASLAARPLTRLADRPWMLLHGPNLPEAARAAVTAGAAPGVTVAPFVPDLAALLKGARVSISQAGYNTVADLLVAGCRAVLLPYAEAGETEQSRRAAILAERGRAVVLPEDGLTPAALAAAVDHALDLPVGAAHPAGTADLDLDGAARTSAVLRAALAMR